MWYWIVVILLILGCAALLGGTFMTIKKNKAEDAMMRRTGGHRRVWLGALLLTDSGPA